MVVSLKTKDGVRFIKKCDKHEKDGGYIWIAMQHPLLLLHEKSETLKAGTKHF